MYFDKQLPQKQKMREYVLQTWTRHPFNCPVSVFLEFLMPIPKSTPKKRLESFKSSFYHKRPDLDNLCKFIGDTFNGILWDDDALIVEMKAVKIYAQQTMTIIHIKEQNDELD